MGRRRVLGALVATPLLLGGCAATVTTAVKLPFEVAGLSLDLAQKSLAVAATGVDLAASSKRLAFGRIDSEIDTAEAGVHVLDEGLRVLEHAGACQAERVGGGARR